MTKWDSAEVGRRIDQLARSRRKSAVLGAISHGFRRQRRLRPAKVAQLERQWNFTIPPDYRRFLLEVEAGGAGPGYGLFSFGTWGGEPFTPAWPDCDPSVAFPHDAPWNLDAEVALPKAVGEDLDRWYERWDEIYFDQGLVAGSVPIAHMGCAMWVRLVVTGSRTGEVWVDDRASDAGIYPLEPAPFIDWYLAWLAEAEGLAKG